VSASSTTKHVLKEPVPKLAIEPNVVVVPNLFGFDVTIELVDIQSYP
jgi:hypothetical protein